MNRSAATLSPWRIPRRGISSPASVGTPSGSASADLTIRAVSVSGKVSELTFRVEVTDDPSRLPATLQVGVLAPRSAQRVPVDESLAVLVQAGGDVGEPAATFTLEVDGLEVDSTPAETSESAASVAVLNWTPRAPGGRHPAGARAHDQRARGGR